jgi:hypothetical protein
MSPEPHRTPASNAGAAEPSHRTGSERAPAATVLPWPGRTAAGPKGADDRPYRAPGDRLGTARGLLLGLLVGALLWILIGIAVWRVLL